MKLILPLFLRLIPESMCEARGIPFVDNGSRDRRTRRKDSEKGRGGRIAKKKRTSDETKE